MRLIHLGLAGALVVAGCKNETTEPARAKDAADGASEAAPSGAASRPSGAASRPSGAASRPSESSSAEARAEAGRARLSKTEAEARAEAGRARLSKTEAGKLILAAVEAHGGLDAWFGAGTLAFRYDYQPKKGTRRNSFQIVDLLSAKAWHDISHPVAGVFAFDGEKAWMKLEDERASFSARFWALTPYYFVGMPFVLSDPGVNLERLDEDPTKAGFPEGAPVVKATFDPGTGDAPDDYYILYLDPKSSRVLGLRYVVSYAPFMKEGRAHTPEKLLVYEALEPAGPLQLARRHVFYAFSGRERGEKVTLAEVSEVELGVELPAEKLEMPEGAKVDDSLEAASAK